VAFDDDEGIWRERQSLTSKEGLTNTQRMVMRPVANGVAEVRTDERTFEELTIRLEEQSENVVLVIATSNRTGTPTASTRARLHVPHGTSRHSSVHFPGKTVFVETTTLVDDLRRVRSVQWFDEDTGAFKRLYLMKEQRCVCWCSVWRTSRVF